MFPSLETECQTSLGIHPSSTRGKRFALQGSRAKRFALQGSRAKRFALQGSRFSVKSLTYQVASYPPRLTREEVDRTVAQAFLLWEEAADISFTRVASGPADIEVRFEAGEHGDGRPFDGAQGAWMRHHGGLGHAHPPHLGGAVHLDAEEVWRVDSSCGTSLLLATAHQVGHALGLASSTVPGAVMFPLFTSGGQVELAEDDKRGIRELYGERRSWGSGP